MIWATIGLAGGAFALDAKQLQKTEALEKRIKELEDKIDN